MHDRQAAGTLRFGEEHPSHRYTDKQLEQVKTLLEKGTHSIKEIMEDTNTSRDFVQLIKTYGTRSPPNTSRKTPMKISERPQSEVVRAIVKAKKRLKANVEIQENGCWNWKGTPGSAGYCQTRFCSEKVLAHIFSWMIYHNNGQRLAPGQQVRHLCKKNRKCVNPRHLVEGTAKDDGMDKRVHGTSRKGENNNQAVFSDTERKELLLQLDEKSVKDVFEDCQNKKLRFTYQQLAGLKKRAKINLRKEKENIAHKRKMEELMSSTSGDFS